MNRTTQTAKVFRLNPDVVPPIHDALSRCALERQNAFQRRGMLEEVSLLALPCRRPNQLEARWLDIRRSLSRFEIGWTGEIACQHARFSSECVSPLLVHRLVVEV